MEDDDKEPTQKLLDHIRDGAGIIGSHDEALRLHHRRIQVFEKLMLEGNGKDPLTVTIAKQGLKIENLEKALTDRKAERRALYVALVALIGTLGAALINKW